MYRWARTGEEIDDNWTCDECQAVNDAIYSDPAAAVKHVTETGHTVTVMRIRHYTLYALRSEVFPEATLF